MPVVYGNERSSMRVSRIVVSFPPRLARMFLRRLLYKYVVYDTSPVALYAFLGALLSGFGTRSSAHITGGGRFKRGSSRQQAP